MPEPATPAARADDSFAGTAVGGMTWVGLTYVLSRGLLLASFVVVARLLDANELGVYAAALVFITYAQAVVDMGVGQALVYLGPNRMRADATLAVSLAISGAIAAIAALASPAIAGFFGRSEITPLLRVLALSLFIGATGVPADAILRWQLRFRRRFVAQVSRAAVQAGVTIGLGVAGAGAWALAWGQIAGVVTGSVVSWALAGYRPSAMFWRPDRAIVRALVSYGAPLAGHTLLLALVADLDYLIVGRRLGPEALGYYAVAFRIPQTVVTNLFFIFSQVLFPIYSKTRHEPARLRRGFGAAIRLQSLAGVGIGVWLAVIAPLLVPAVFGPRWAPSIVPLQALGLYAAFRSLSGGAADIFGATGRPRLALWSSFGQLVLLVPALIIGSAAGIEGVAWAQAGTAVVVAVSLLGIAGRLLGVGVRWLGRAIAPALAAGIATAVATAVVRVVMPGPPLAQVIVSACAGAFAAVGTFALADRTFAAEMIVLIRARLAQARGGSSDVAPDAFAFDDGFEVRSGRTTEGAL